jgi:putative transposase
MKRSRFSEEQIIAVLKEQEAGMPTADVCRRHGISSATFYKWTSNYGGLEVSDARRLRQLEQERDRDQVWLRIDHIGHRRSAARTKPVSDLASRVSGPNKFEPVPLNSDSFDRKANLCRKGAPGPLLAGPAVTDRKSEGLA